jgi:hypothetical protein
MNKLRTLETLNHPKWLLNQMDNFREKNYLKLWIALHSLESNIVCDNLCLYSKLYLPAVTSQN